jgi:hypothetical protein
MSSEQNDSVKQELHDNQSVDINLIADCETLFTKSWRKKAFDSTLDDAIPSFVLCPYFQKNKFRKTKEITNRVSTDLLKQVEIENTFMKLADQWRRETRGVSSTNQMSMHPAYQQIIGMGEAVVPLLLRELERKSGQWFWALKAITREDPVPPKFRGRTKEMIRLWLDWGRQKGYTW